MGSCPNDAKWNKIFMDRANKFSFLVQDYNFAAFAKNYKVPSQISNNALLDGLFNLNFVN